MSDRNAEARYRAIHRRAHADHPGCLADEWLSEPCADADGTPIARPLVWSRRNGPWRQHDTLWVGAAPGNDGGMGSGGLGAHGTRVPFGGDIAGANLDVFLTAMGLDRNRTFIVASLNRLPDRGGGEPRVSELREPVGAIASSIHLLRETLLAAAPRLVIALGNIGLRTTVAAARLEEKTRLTLTGLERLERAGLERGAIVAWPERFPPDDAFRRSWSEVRPDSAPPRILWLLHPSAQNMSPHAGTETVFHTRMLETLDALRAAGRELYGSVPDPADRPHHPDDGIYALPEWREAIGPRHSELDALWRAKGV